MGGTDGKTGGPKQTNAELSVVLHSNRRLQTSYSFAVNGSKHTVGPYWEHLETTLTGAFLSPDRLKGLRVPLVFLGRREHQSALEEPTNSDWKPRNVGVLTLRGQRREFLGSLPYDALWGLLHTFSSGVFRIVHLHGILERGRAEMRSVNFARTSTPTICDPCYLKLMSRPCSPWRYKSINADSLASCPFTKSPSRLQSFRLAATSTSRKLANIFLNLRKMARVNSAP